jgi:nucleoside-diphosphate-sugar epimerase
MARALVTGIDGFTGGYVARALEDAGYEVTGLSHSLPVGERRMRVDLLDRDALGAAIARVRPDVVVHLAAISFVPHGDAEALYRVNVVGTRNLLEALARTDGVPKAVVLASSANVYRAAGTEPIREEEELAPANDYAVSKLAMEYMAGLWKDRLPITIVRPFNYTGVGQAQEFLVPKIVYHFRQREAVIELGNTRVCRDFSDVRDVAEAYVRILQRAPSAGILNIWSGRGYSLEQVLSAMSDLAGYEIEVRVNPAFVRSNEIPRLVGSNERLRTSTGVAMGIRLEDTLAWMYAG